MLTEIRQTIRKRVRGVAPTPEREWSWVDKQKSGWLQGTPAWGAKQEESGPMPLIIAVGSGKGGVGKSLISSNLSTLISQEGYRCLLIDMDLGSSNIHTYFGAPKPAKSLSDFARDAATPFDRLFAQGPNSSLTLIHGGRIDVGGFRNSLESSFLGRFWQELRRARSLHGFDVVFLDLGAGTHELTLNLFSLAHLGLITVLPEPTSIENAYVFLRGYLFRLIENLGHHLGREQEAYELIAVLESLKAERIDGGYLSLLRQEYAKHPEFVRKLGEVVMARRLGLMVNQVRAHEDAAIGPSMESICRSFYGFQSQFLGYLNYDDVAWKSLRNQRLLLLDFPHSLIVQRMKQLVKNLLTLCR